MVPSCGMPFFCFSETGLPRPGVADIDRIARLTYVGKLADHQSASPADLPTNNG